MHPNGARVPVTTENLLLRECLLKNTDFIEGIVVYSGHETKAMLNNGGPRYKVTLPLSIVQCHLEHDVSTFYEISMFHHNKFVYN